MKSIVVAFCLMFGSISTFAEDRIIKLAGFEMPPFISQSLPEKGFFPFLLNRAMRDSGWAIEVELLPIRRAIVSVDTGGHDGYLMAPVNSASQRHTFTAALINSKVAFYGLKSERSSYSEPSSLHGQRVGEMSGWGSESAFPDINWISVDNPEQMALMLLAKRVSAFIYEDLSFQYLMLTASSGKPQEIVPFKPSLFDIGYGIGFRGSLGISASKFEILNEHIEIFVERSDIKLLFEEYLDQL